MAENPWKRARKKFPELIQALQPLRLLDSLFSKELILLEEFAQLKLTGTRTPQDAARCLLVDMLMPRLPTQETFNLFCEVLDSVPQQRGILELIKPHSDDGVEEMIGLIDQLVGGEATGTGKDETWDYQFKRDEIEYDEETDDIPFGEFGEIYKARITKTRETVALKVLHRQRRRSDLSKALRKEASILLALKPHLHILKFLGVCEELRFYALVMEYVDGRELGQFLASFEPEVEKWETRFDIAHQVALGMNHLHSNSPPIIYLNLTSSNVLIKRLKENEFICKIFGFSLAKMSNVSSMTKRRSEEAIPSGTVAYIAPERYESSPYGTGDSDEKREVAKKSDVFSYGVLLWEIRERESPFKDLPEMCIHLHIKSGGKLPKGRHVGRTAYDQLVTDCTVFDPKQRPSFPAVISTLNIN